MNIMLFLGFLTSLYGGNNNEELLQIDIRERIVNNNQIRIVVQIDNNTKREISKLDGFLMQIDNKGIVISENRLTFLEVSDGVLKPNQSVSKFMVVPLNRIRPDHYEFYVGKIRFQNDYRVYTYHPSIGFYRED